MSAAAVKARELRQTPRTFLIAAAHVTVLTSFALAQPLFDLLGKNPEFFAARASPPAEIVGFALIVTFGVPLVVIALELGADFVHPFARVAVHLAAVGLLVAVFALQTAATRTDGSAAVLIPLAVVVAGIFTLAYSRAGPVRSFLTLLTPAPLVFLVLFLFHGQVAELVRPSNGAAFVASVDAETPVVMVILDELPIMSLMDAEEEIDAVRYPSFGALARDSVWYRNTTTVSDWTAYAAPPILSGVYSDGTELPIAANYPRTIFTLLGQSYETKAFMPFPQLCPADLCSGREVGTSERVESLISDVSIVYGHLLLPRDMRDDLPPIEGTWGDFQGVTDTTDPVSRKVRTPEGGPALAAALAEALDTRSESLAGFLASLTPSREPTLRLLHMIFPHRPFDRMPSGKHYGEGSANLDGIDGTEWLDNEYLVRQGWQRHLLQTVFTDRVLGEILRRLKRIGVYERALIVVTADHGASFKPNHSFRRMDEETLPDIALVPLFVKLPNGEDAGSVVDRHVQTVDILPTITDVLDLDPGWDFDGRSMLEGGTSRLTIVAKDGSSRTAEIADLLEGRRRHLQEQVEIFGTADDRPGLFGLGPNPELVGQAVDDLPAVDAGRMSAALDRPRDFRSVETDTVYVPSWITGTIDAASGSGPLELAVAVNGRIAAVGESFRRPGEDRDRFAFVVPESAFRTGANDVALYLVRPAGATSALASLTPD